jgi:putative hemolysin
VSHVRAALTVLACLMALTLAPVAAQDDAAGWCTSHDGTVVERYPASMASSDEPVALGTPVQFCEFTGGEGADPADSHISVALTTLASPEPSMAASAYLTKPAMPESGGSANPASVYCADLGGTELGGQLAPDGGWVNSKDKTDVAEMCVFPDLSIIDSWGLAYHTMGTIRGANLESIFRSQPSA